MILVFPYIKMRNGECSFCIKGDKDTDAMYNEYSHNPLKLLELWRRENSKTIHITDLDSVEKESNIETANSILFLANSIDIPVQLYSKFKDIDECRMYLESGIYRIVIGELINSDSEGIKQLIRDYSASRIAFGGVMNNNNFISSGLITFSSYCEKVHSLGGNRIVILDKNWETKTPDFEMFREMHSLYKLRFTLIEACKNYKDLETLNNNAKYGIDSIVLGDSLYLNNFPCQKIWRIAEALIEPDIYKPKG